MADAAVEYFGNPAKAFGHLNTLEELHPGIVALMRRNAEFHRAQTEEKLVGFYGGDRFPETKKRARELLNWLLKAICETALEPPAFIEDHYRTAFF